MKNIVDIGTITMFVNIPRWMQLSDKDQDYLSNEVVNLFKNRFSHSVYKTDIRVLSYSCRGGCLLIEITIGVAAVAAYKFVKDYKSLREGILLMANDISNTYIFIKDKCSKHKICLYRDDLLETKLFSKNVDLYINTQCDNNKQ